MMATLVEQPFSGTAARRLTLARFYLTLAKEHSRSEREQDLFLTIILLQESLETFLVAAADHVNAQIPSRADFITYIDKIDERLSPGRLPFRSTIIRINKARVQAKHDVLLPDRVEIPSFLTSSEEFLKESCQTIFDCDFSTVSLVNLLPDGAVKDALRSAEEAFKVANFPSVLIECRKAVYLTFEKRFDIRPLLDHPNPNGLFGLGLSSAPAYARNKDYAKSNVREPFHYIVLDHSKLDEEMVKDGIDPHHFWNIWRLTPSVYEMGEGNWLVRQEPSKANPDEAEQHAPYVLDATINLIFLKERKKQSLRWSKPSFWKLRVKTSGAPIYYKASISSDIIGHIPIHLDYVTASAGLSGLDGEGYFWQIFRTEDIKEGSWFVGYVRDEDFVAES